MVSSGGAGSSELVVDGGVNGFVFRANDEGDLAAKMLQALMGDGGDAMGSNGRQVATMHTMAKTMERLTQIFKETTESA